MEYETMQSVGSDQSAKDGRRADDVDFIWSKVVSEVRKEYLSNTQSFPWIIGFSGGKDSTVLAQAVMEMILSIPPSKRSRHVHVVSNDTLVESPPVIEHLHKTQAAIQATAESWKLPITVVTTKPDEEKTFWTLLIGKGYPTPNQNLRWCTDRLKILPTSIHNPLMTTMALGMNTCKISACRFALRPTPNPRRS